MRKRRVNAKPQHCHMRIVWVFLPHPLKTRAVHRRWMLLSSLECRAMLGLGGLFLPRTFTFLNGGSRMKSTRLPIGLYYLTFPHRTGFLRAPPQSPAMSPLLCSVMTKSKRFYPLLLYALWLTCPCPTWYASYRPWHLIAR